MQRRSADDALIFVTIAETGSVAAAARELEMSASTLSRRLAAMEERLGVMLVERTTRSFHLTEVGRAFRERAHAMVLALADAEAVAKSYGKVARGTLRIAAPPVLGAFALGELLAHYAHRCPEVHVEVVLGDLPVDLRAERFDLAIRLGLPSNEGTDRMRHVGVSPRVLCASPSYLEQHGIPATLADLTQHLVVVLGSKSHTMPWSFIRDGAVVNATIRSKLRANSSLLARELCRSGVGLALLPRFLAREELDSRALIEVVLDVLPEPAEVHLILAMPGARTAKVRAFVDLVGSRLPGLEGARK